MSIEETQIQALNILIGGIRLAQKKGCYSLEEASQLSLAVSVFTNPATADDEKDETAGKRKKK